MVEYFDEEKGEVVRYIREKVKKKKVTALKKAIMLKRERVKADKHNNTDKNI